MPKKLLLIIVLLTPLLLPLRVNAFQFSDTTNVAAHVHTDIDNDGIPNWWELQHGFDPADPSDATLDPDGDGLTNLVEYGYSTNPRNRDTDGGGVWDDLEIRLKKDPLNPRDDFDPISYRDPPENPTDLRGDSDGDGISNNDEKEYGTDSHKVDTDDDGLNDYDEIFKYRTNPTEPDTDLDRLSDGDEIQKYGTNPNNPDTDYDGLFDIEELFTYNTNPTLWDTDGGGMSDRDEIANESDPTDTGDDYQLYWILFYGEEPNELFKTLDFNKINVYQGMNLSLEVIKPPNAKKIAVTFNDKEFTSEKNFVKLNILSPDKPGLYELVLKVILDEGKEISMTRFIELRPRGVITRRADGTFNSLYDQIDYLDDQPLSNAKIEVLIYNELTGNLELFESSKFPQANPQYTDENGGYLLVLDPGTYLIRVSKPEFGKKEILYTTDTNSIYSNNIYLTYEYDNAVWGGIFASVFFFSWYLQIFIVHLRHWIDQLIKHRIKSGKVH